MLNPKESYKNLQTSKTFLDWKKKHQKSFLSHFFYPLNEEINLKGSEEMGLFDPDEGKIYVFISSGKNEYTLRPADDVFKKEETQIEKLDLSGLKVNFEKSKEICQEKILEFFPAEKKKDGFCVLQTLDSKLLWNFTFITTTLKFINVKIDAKTGEMNSQQEIDLVAK